MFIFVNVCIRVLYCLKEDFPPWESLEAFFVVVQRVKSQLLQSDATQPDWWYIPIACNCATAPILCLVYRFTKCTIQPRPLSNCLWSCWLVQKQSRIRQGSGSIFFYCLLLVELWSSLSYLIFGPAPYPPPSPQLTPPGRLRPLHSPAPAYPPHRSAMTTSKLAGPSVRHSHTNGASILIGWFHWLTCIRTGCRNFTAWKSHCVLWRPVLQSSCLIGWSRLISSWRSCVIGLSVLTDIARCRDLNVWYGCLEMHRIYNTVISLGNALFSWCSEYLHRAVTALTD